MCGDVFIVSFYGFDINSYVFGFVWGCIFGFGFCWNIFFKVEVEIVMEF